MIITIISTDCLLQEHHAEERRPDRRGDPLAKLGEGDQDGAAEGAHLRERAVSTSEVHK